MDLSQISGPWFSVTDHFRDGNAQPDHLHGVYFFYDFSPIKVIFTEENRSFLHYVTQLCAIIGGFPDKLFEKSSFLLWAIKFQILGESIGEVKRVTDMHERKSEMVKNADAFIALPGGYGTMEELLEIIAWSQLGIHHKLVGILNVDGYYNDLIQLFDKGVREGFIEDSVSHIVISADNAEELPRKMEAKAGEERRREANKKRRSS
ncbi:hypothetical protein ZIOFF_040982 [Zingiber officinale]|uniref:Cytokinin riboside 5'-monophosphate phosphoribohydrolase n=1 Tax=Zingiber officinale TaxID=94328 RepID=A0A8J5KYE7_ZINOF|nr:hypothetical protein ZIOFF_040982 [Zingiber officinale]